jgi:hypothetical protein
MPPRTLLALCLGIFLTQPVWARRHAFVGFHRTLKDTQNSKGKVEDKPLSPTVGLGYNFNLFNTGLGFSPQVGYIHTDQTANDSFGKQKIHSFFLNWDLLWISSLSNNLAFRFGLGTFIKRIRGEGGTVEIPNGSGTDQARRPSGTVTSYSSTFNLGADYNFGLSAGEWIDDAGLRFELYTFRPLSSENRNYAFNFGVILYF